VEGGKFNHSEGSKKERKGHWRGIYSCKGTWKEICGIGRIRKKLYISLEGVRRREEADEIN